MVSSLGDVFFFFFLKKKKKHIGLILSLAIGTVWLRLSIIRTSYAINKTHQELKLVRQETELLQFKVAALRSPRRLEILARTKWGLSPPRMTQVIHFKRTKSDAELEEQE